MAQNAELNVVREITYGNTAKTPRLNVAFTVSADVGNAVTVTAQLYENETALAQTTLVDVWLSATAGAAPSAVDSESITAGTEITEVVNHGHYKCLTNSSGTLTIAWTKSGDATRYCNVAFNGVLFSSSVMTWTS